MPLPNNPNIPEFYVYRFEVRGIPFYVGIGRSERASDRIRYVRHCMDREAQGKPVKWALHCSVIAQLLRDGHEVCLTYVLRDVVRADALKSERAEINRLLAEGTPLANLQHNPRRPGSTVQFVESLRLRLRSAQGQESRN